MRSSRIKITRLALNGSVCIRDRRRQDTDTEERPELLTHASSHNSMIFSTFKVHKLPRDWVSLPQAKGCLESPGAGREEDFGAFGGSVVLLTCWLQTSALWSHERINSYCLKTPSCGHLLGQPRKLI